MTKAFLLILSLTVLICLAAPLNALPLVDVEVAVGAWRQSPSGVVSYKSDDEFDLEDTLGYDDETAFFGRLKIELPFPVPSIYLMYSPLKFEATSVTDGFYDFGGITVVPGIPFYSKLSADQYDIGLYYRIPLLKQASFNRLNIELGINTKIIDAEAEVVQDTFAPIYVLRETEQDTLAVPMAYLGAQFRPLQRLSLEGEFRGLSWSDSSFYSFIGRVKADIWGPLFAAGGYRFDTGDSTEWALKFDADFQGPFIETGFHF